MKDFIALLINQSHAEQVVVNQALTDALARLDLMLEGLCGDLQVEFHGPFVGVETPKAHQMVVRAHEWKIHQPAWSVKICVASPEAHDRAEWAMQGVGRLRKQVIVKALPDFFAGYAEAIEAAGKTTTAAGQRVLELARQFNPQPGTNATSPCCKNAGGVKG